MIYKCAPWIDYDANGIVILQVVSDNNVVNTECLFYADKNDTEKIVRKLGPSFSDEAIINHCLDNKPANANY